jgi:hypothetical protein
MRYPGEVYFLPPDAREGGDPKPRRHLLLTTQKEPGDSLVFAYTSRQATEASHGAAHYVVDPYATSYRHTGFDAASYVYPSRLVPAAEEDLSRLMGRLLDDMPTIRDTLRAALGLGTGTGAGTGGAAGSLRGTVARFNSRVTAENGIEYGVIVTEPRYSFARRYQNVVPILNAAEFEPEHLEVYVESAPWLDRVAGGLRAAILSAPEVFSVFHPHEIMSAPIAIVDEATMSRVDAALAYQFDL